MARMVDRLVQDSLSTAIDIVVDPIDEDLAGLYLSLQISKEQAIANARARARFEALTREVPTKKKGLFG